MMKVEVMQISKQIIVM
jgi:hypothetical protein